MSNDSATHSGNMKELESDESFIDSWLREGREDDNLSNEILELIDANRDGSNLDLDGLIDALINHAEDTITKDDE